MTSSFVIASRELLMRIIDSIRIVLQNNMHAHIYTHTHIYVCLIYALIVLMKSQKRVLQILFSSPFIFFFLSLNNTDYFPRLEFPPPDKSHMIVCIGHNHLALG